MEHLWQEASRSYRLESYRVRCYHHRRRFGLLWNSIGCPRKAYFKDNLQAELSIRSKLNSLEFDVAKDFDENLDKF